MRSERELHILRAIDIIDILKVIDIRVYCVCKREKEEERERERENFRYFKSNRCSCVLGL